MKFGLRVLEDADADVDELATFLGGESIDAAMRFCEAIPKTYVKIADQPMVYARYLKYDDAAPHIRMCPVVGFPNYLVFFLIDADMVEILRVLHGSRDIRAILVDEE